MKTRIIIAAAALAITLMTSTASTQDAPTPEPDNVTITDKGHESEQYIVKIDAVAMHEAECSPAQYKEYISIRPADAVAERDEEATEEAQEPPEPVQTYAGVYELTAYVATGNPCADGVYPVVGYTAASNDPALWHKRILIKGYGEYYIHDTGGMAVNVIDLFFGSYDEAVQFGRQTAEVYILE